MRKSAGGGMAAAAALMTANTKPIKRLMDSNSTTFDWQFAFYIDRPHRSHDALLENSDAPPPVSLVLRVARHCSPDPCLIRDSLHMMLSNEMTASPAEEEELMQLEALLSSSVLYYHDVTLRVLFARVLIRRKVTHLAHQVIRALPTYAFSPILWHEVMEFVTHGRMNDVDLLTRLLDDNLFPLQLADIGSDARQALVDPNAHASHQLVHYGIAGGLASKLLLTTPRFPAVSNSILKRYIATVKLIAGTLHPAPFLAFFRCVQDVRDPHAKTPMVHWKLILRYFQQLNKSCPTWYVSHPAEAADLVKYVILTCSSGANPHITVNIARVAASRHILDGVELSLWLVHRMVLSHHVEETKEVAHRLVHWLFHTVGIHLLPQFHPHMIPLARNLLNVEAIGDVGFIYSIIIDHVVLFSEEFRQQWMATMYDLLCSSCGSIFEDQNVYTDRVCSTCMHVTPAKPIAEAASYVLTAEHLERLRRRRKAANREGKQRLRNLVSVHQKASSSDSAKAPMSATDLFKTEVLSSRKQSNDADATTLIEANGSRSAANDLQIGDSSNLSSLVLHKDASATDVRAAVEEATRRKELLEGIRAQRVKHAQLSSSSHLSSVTVPSTIPQLQADVQLQFRVARERAVLAQTVKVDGAWQCVWCQEANSAQDSRVTCAACGAETGPEASWRTFLSEGTSDIRDEIRIRIRSGDPADAVIAAYNLMVYRRSFLMHATEIDYVLLEDLVRQLVALHERVLAGYLFMRMIPASRRANSIGCMREVATLFGNEAKFMSAMQGETPISLTVDAVVFDAIFNAEKTCKVCFGGHRWEDCPIVTRDFTSTRVSINLSPEEKKRSAYEHLKAGIAAAVAATLGATTSSKVNETSTRNRAKQVASGAVALVHAAYQLFLSSNREPFAIEHPVDTNNLSRALSCVGEYVRGSFVLLHIPVHMRQHVTYSDAVGYFGVSSDDFAALMQKRSAVGVNDGSHPNFVQVTRTCCICLEKQHASFLCPRMIAWVSEVKQLMQVGCGTGTDLVLSGEKRATRIARLRAQVDGWVYSGPERLETFQRFLIENLEELISTKTEETNPAYHAFNKTVICLLERGKHSHALRLYARLPMAFVSHGTTAAMLMGAAGYSLETVKTLATSAHDGGRGSVFQPNERCLCCFELGHSFLECPDIVGFASSERIVRVIDSVGAIRSSSCGVLAAADYVYREYNFSHLSTEMLRAKPDVVQKVLKLLHKCFAAKLISRGVRLLRRVPVEMLEPRHYETMWRATGMPEDLVAERMQNLQTLLDDQKLCPSSSTPQARRNFPKEFITALAGLIHGDHCRHCYAYGHSMSGCVQFHEEAEFGRDFISVYRITTLFPNLYENERLSVYALLAKFLLEHQLVLPYHILGVHNGINAISATLSMDHEPGLGLRILLTLPPAYRKRHAMHYALNALGLSKLQIINVLKPFYVTGDAPPPLLQHRGDEHAMGTAQRFDAMEPQHLIVMRPPIPDLLQEQVIGAVEGGKAAVGNAEARLQSLAVLGMKPRVFVTDADERESMQLPVDFAQMFRELMVTVDSSFSASLAASAPSASSPSGKVSVGSLASSGSSSSPYRVKQVCEISDLREAFSPLIDFMEAVCGSKLGSRSPLLQVSEILRDVVEGYDNKNQRAAINSEDAAVSIQSAVKRAPVETPKPRAAAAASSSGIQQARHAPSEQVPQIQVQNKQRIPPVNTSSSRVPPSDGHFHPRSPIKKDVVESIVHRPHHAHQSNRHQQHNRSKFGQQQRLHNSNRNSTVAAAASESSRNNTKQHFTPRANHQHSQQQRHRNEVGGSHQSHVQQQQERYVPSSEPTRPNQQPQRRDDNRREHQPSWSKGKR